VMNESTRGNMQKGKRHRGPLNTRWTATVSRSFLIVPDIIKEEIKINKFVFVRNLHVCPFRASLRPLKQS
jgi:hypothetical protein